MISRSLTWSFELKFNDMNRRESFENLAKWAVEIDEYCEPDVSIVLVGNKCDMENVYKGLLQRGS